MVFFIQETRLLIELTNEKLKKELNECNEKYYAPMNENRKRPKENYKIVMNFSHLNAKDFSIKLVPGNIDYSKIFGYENIIIPNSVTSINGGAFLYCENLTSITIPNSVTSIGNSAFYYCKRLQKVYYNSTENEWNNVSIGSTNTNLTNVTRIYFAYVDIYDYVGKFNSQYKANN